MRAAVELELRSITSADEADAAHLRDAMSWVASGAPLFRTAKPATPPKHLVAYFAVVGEGQILLVNHRAAQRWLPTGGHVEPGEHPRQTVVRELREELGLVVALSSIGAPLMVSCTETVGRVTRHTDVSLWYLVSGSPAEQLSYDTVEFSEVRWFPLGAAPLAQSDPHLGRLLRKIGGVVGTD